MGLYDYQQNWFEDDPKGEKTIKSGKLKGSGDYAIENEALDSNTSSGSGKDKGSASSISKQASSASSSFDSSSAVSGALGGLSAGFTQGEQRKNDPFYQNEAEGLEAISLSSQMTRENVRRQQKKGKMSDTDYVVADIWTGIGGGATNGFGQSGSWIGAVVGALTGGISSAVEGDKARTKARNDLRKEEFEIKKKYREQAMAMSKAGAVSGAYESEYTPLSQLIIDKEKNAMNAEMQKAREMYGMKDLNTNFYST